MSVLAPPKPLEHIKGVIEYVCPRRVLVGKPYESIVMVSPVPVELRVGIGLNRPVNEPRKGLELFLNCFPPLLPEIILHMATYPTKVKGVPDNLVQPARIVLAEVPYRPDSVPVLMGTV